MPRKFRLSHKKNEERKKYSSGATSRSDVSTSVPLSGSQDKDALADSPTELIVSFPLAHFTTAPVATLDALYKRLTVLRPFPSGWIDATVDSNEEITLCQFSRLTSAVTPAVSFTLKIAKDLSWTLFFFSQRIKADQCSTLVSTQLLLGSSVDVTNLVAAISGSCICVGNPDDKFRPLLTKRQGVFMDQHGKKATSCHSTYS